MDAFDRSTTDNNYDPWLIDRMSIILHALSNYKFVRGQYAPLWKISFSSLHELCNQIVSTHAKIQQKV